MNRILIVDDEATMLKGITFHLQENSSYEIFTAAERKPAIEFIENNELDLIVTDLMMPKVEDGLAVIKAAKDQWYQPSVLAMTAFETVENVVETMRAGADDFVSKGFGIDELSMRIDNLLKKKQQFSQLSIENRILKETIQHHFSDFQIIGKSKQILNLLEKIKKIAKDARATCLIEGESGSGKDLIARIIHALSSRRQAPFVPINCAAIPENLIESELFGHEKGSFTGAYSTRQGKFEHANGGIIFLDEIDKITGNKGGGHGPDVSREGVQRDLLPVVEGTTVATKYGMVKTDHILFIASGAFHVAKPSDLIPELQGRFPIRVELDSLNTEDFIRILQEPENALIKQYTELLKTENLTLEFTPDAIKEIAETANYVNSKSENIGARRLHTVMSKLLENLLFEAPDMKDKKIVIDKDFVRNILNEIVKDEDLSKYIL